MDDNGKIPTPSRGVPVELDRTRYFRYTLGALRKIREELGDDALSAGVSGEKLAKVFWYGLVGDDPTITIDQIENLIDLENLQDVVHAMRKAMGQKASANVDPRAVAPAAPVVAAE